MGIVAKAGGSLRFVLFLIVGVVLFLGIVAASFWGMDYGVQATVVDAECGTTGSTVAVQEKLTRFRHTQPIETQECLFADEGHFAIYNIRSERLRMYTSEGGHCYWDSHGVENCFVPAETRAPSEIS